MSDMSIANNLAPEEKPLSDAQNEAIALKVAQARKIFPGLANEVRALVDAGLIQGWRNLEYIGPPREETGIAFDATQLVILRPEKPVEVQRKR
jgi:hypothetical protein